VSEKSLQFEMTVT